MEKVDISFKGAITVLVCKVPLCKQRQAVSVMHQLLAGLLGKKYEEGEV